MENIEEKIIVAVISLIVTIITTLLIKPLVDKHLHRYKLNMRIEG